MQRRLLLSLAAVPGALALTGCGFKLRSAPRFAFKTIYLTLAEGSALGNELKRLLEANGDVRVISDSRDMAKADVVLEAVNEQREKTVVGMNAAGQVRELQLRLRFAFKLRTQQGKELIPRTELLLQRDSSFNETDVLAKQAEELLLYRDMQNDIVRQVVRRLSAVQSL